MFTFVNVIKFRWVYSSILSTKKLSQCSSSLAEIQTLRSKNRFISKLSAMHFLKNLSLQSVYQIIYVRQSFFLKGVSWFGKESTRYKLMFWENLFFNTLQFTLFSSYAAARRGTPEFGRLWKSGTDIYCDCKPKKTKNYKLFFLW